MHVVDVLGEVVQRVAPRRRYAHAQLERRRVELGERGFDLQPVMLWFRNRKAIGDWSGGAERASGKREQHRADERDVAHSPPTGGHYPPPSACSTNASGGSAPRISTESFTTVFGTPVTEYFRARSGNSVASTANAVMFGFANAISCASATARGQCGHVGVVNTCIVVGDDTAATRFRLSSDNTDGRPPTSSTA